MAHKDAHEKLTEYMRRRGLDPGPEKAARGWYADLYSSLPEMAEVWDTKEDNKAWQAVYSGSKAGRQPLGPLTATRLSVHWTALGRRDHNAQFLSDGGQPIRPVDFRVRYPMLRFRFGGHHLRRLAGIIKLFAGGK